MRLAAHITVVGVLALLALLGTQPRYAASANVNSCFPVVCSSLLSLFTNQSPGPRIASASALETLESGAPSRFPDAPPDEDSGAGAESMMLNLINSERIESGLAPFEVDDQLAQLARIRSLDMAEKNYFGHIAPDGSSARSLMIDSQIGPGLMGEILGRNNSTDTNQSVTSVVEAFLDSPGHHAAIHNPRFVWAGIGKAVGPEYMSYYTVLFFGP